MVDYIYNKKKIWGEKDYIKNFNNNKNNIISFKKIKKRSPDFKYIVSPSLDDKIVPMVCAIDRQDFKITHTFMGPFSSINCVKFNPHLFIFENNKISIFAMGDNDGNISIWGLSDKLVMNKQFFLFKSHYNGTEII